MNDTTVIEAQAPELQTASKVVPVSSQSPYPLPEVPSSQQGSISLNRRASGSGQIMLDTCPAPHSVDDCAGCHLRALCRCAYADFLAAGTREQRVWIVLALSAAVTILYAAYCFFGGR